MKAKAKLIAVAAILLLAACNKEDEQIKVYRVARAPLENAAGPQVPQVVVPPSANALPPNHPPVGSGTGAGPMSAANPAANVTVPPHWKPQPLAQMRQASFLINAEDGTSADISLVTLGSTGDVLGNVNRWLGQLGQPPITDEGLPQVVQHLPSELGHVALVDIAGKPEGGDASKDGRIVAAIAPAENGTQFFKLRGNPALVGAEKENFIHWVTAIRSRAQ